MKSARSVLNGSNMWLQRAPIATSMSCFLASLVIAGCFHIESTGTEQPQPDAPVPSGTSLDGTIECGSMKCGSQTLCTHWSSGIDAGVPGNSESCEIVPAGCRVSDCSASNVCSPCIRALCSSAGYSDYVHVDGRDLYCPGV